MRYDHMRMWYTREIVAVEKGALLQQALNAMQKISRIIEVYVIHDNVTIHFVTVAKWKLITIIMHSISERRWPKTSPIKQIFLSHNVNSTENTIVWSANKCTAKCFPLNMVNTYIVVSSEEFAHGGCNWSNLHNWRPTSTTVSHRWAHWRTSSPNPRWW